MPEDHQDLSEACARIADKWIEHTEHVAEMRDRRVREEFSADCLCSEDSVSGQLTALGVMLDGYRGGML